MKNTTIMLFVAGVVVCGGVCSNVDAEQPQPQKKIVLESEMPPQNTQPEYRYIEECPLSKELQRGIFDICAEYNVSYELVMAMIKQESDYDANAEGDNCKSIGLMQIQKKWHSEIMAELGVSDLYEPLDNVKVGVALLADYFKEGNEVYYVLMKYNGGKKYADRMIEAGVVSSYALEITERAYKYERDNGI